MHSIKCVQQIKPGLVSSLTLQNRLGMSTEQALIWMLEQLDFSFKTSLGLRLVMEFG